MKEHLILALAITLQTKELLKALDVNIGFRFEGE